VLTGFAREVRSGVATKGQTVNFKNLKTIRTNKGVTQRAVATAIGVPYTTYLNWEQLKNNPSLTNSVKLASYFNCRVDDFFASSVPRVTIEPSCIPVLGGISAGDNLEVIRNSEVYTEIWAGLASEYPQAFALRIEGDSMNKVVLDGSLAILTPTDDESELVAGDIVAVSIDGEAAVLKTFTRTPNGVVFSPDSTNLEHKDKVIDARDPAAATYRIIGKMVGARYPEL
jgi:repressor LexA